MRATETQTGEIADYAADLKRANEARDNWRDSSKEWEAKFKLAAADLAKQAEEIEVLKEKLGYAEWRAADDAVDAQKWRNSLKRSRDRKAAKKPATPPARDKRAKNRGGARG